ncbi:hypothetical protein [Pseudarthrobacter sp. NamE5]|uniref:hypothetical protein n=1 Tax=Pseudarthrobacter sp. NamE5 TaxID=2576839 RepID=UPI00110B6641|nr:hypothetical protein [Pseudarthrobacter sp. NamE5]TLM80828.1 hypothetical protein FDW84_18440 [Pseudarthrobacter sp. NamE5]
MGFFNRHRDRQSDAVGLFYFHLDALESSVIHPKFIDPRLVNSLCLTDSDADYAFSVVEFIEFCSGANGAPTTSSQRATILATLQTLRRDVPSSQFDYRFCLYELNELKSILGRMRKTWY